MAWRDESISRWDPFTLTWSGVLPSRDLRGSPTLQVNCKSFRIAGAGDGTRLLQAKGPRRSAGNGIHLVDLNSFFTIFDTVTEYRYRVNY